MSDSLRSFPKFRACGDSRQFITGLICLLWVGSALAYEPTPLELLWADLEFADQRTIIQEYELIRDKCTGPENLDRELLQQTWFHDVELTDRAGMIGLVSYNINEPGESIKPWFRGAFCIEGDYLYTVSFERSFEPSEPRRNERGNWVREYVRTLTPVSEGRVMVNHLDEHKLILKFPDHPAVTFYR